MLNGHQLNDSFIIVQALAPLLHGAKLSEEDLAFEKQMAYGFQSACLSNVMENGWNFRKMVGKWFGCGAANCLTFCCCNCPCYRHHMLNKKKQAGDKNTAADIYKYLIIIEERLEKHEFLSGKELGILDLSLYGMTHTFSSEPNMGFFQDMLDKSEKFARWWLKMHNIVGVVN